MHITRKNDGNRVGEALEILGRHPAVGGTDQVSMLLTHSHPGDKGEPHHHDHTTEVYWIVSGRAQMVIDGEAYDVSKNDVIMVEPGEVHALNCPDDAEEDVYYVAICVGAWTPEDHHVDSED